MKIIDDAAQLRIHSLLPQSRANGPGTRFVIWVQGCSFHCPGCFNPATWDIEAGYLITANSLFEQILAEQDNIEGISISGGEPLQQIIPLLNLMEKVKQETALSILLFTGYSWDEILAFTEAERLITCLDVLIAGRYNENLPCTKGLIASTNQTLHLLTDRYNESDLNAVPETEIILDKNGHILISGINPLILKKK